MPTNALPRRQAPGGRWAVEVVIKRQLRVLCWCYAGMDQGPRAATFDQHGDEDGVQDHQRDRVPTARTAAVPDTAASRA
jgi:hypothetical protein